MVGNGGTVLAATDNGANYVIFHAALFLSRLLLFAVPHYYGRMCVLVTFLASSGWEIAHQRRAEFIFFRGVSGQI
jgi:hypothetical protein